MLVETLLLLLLTFIARSEFLLGTSLIERPIVLGALVGLVMGDLQTGIIMGGTLELAFIGAVSIGAYIPPDMVSGTILGVAFAMKAGSGPESALALGMPIATIMLAINTITSAPILLYFTHKSDAAALRGDDKAIERNLLIGGYAQSIGAFIIIPLAYYFGSDAVTAVLGSIPEFIQTGMNVATGLIPALGFAMLAQMIMNKKVAPYFFLGYFAVAYLGISTTGIAIFAVIIAALVFFREDPKATPDSNPGDSGEGVMLDEF